jgi:prevent-host-death family protein
MTISPAIMKTVKERVLSASEFKAKCLAYLSEIERSGEAITITRRGRPVAVLGRAKLPTQSRLAIVGHERRESKAIL